MCQLEAESKHPDKEVGRHGPIRALASLKGSHPWAVLDDVASLCCCKSNCNFGGQRTESNRAGRQGVNAIRKPEKLWGVR